METKDSLHFAGEIPIVKCYWKANITLAPLTPTGTGDFLLITFLWTCPEKTILYSVASNVQPQAAHGEKNEIDKTSPIFQPLKSI